MGNDSLFKMWMLSFRVLIIVSSCFGLFLLITVKRKRTTDNNMVAYSNFYLLALLTISGLCSSVFTIGERISSYMEQEFASSICDIFNWMMYGIYLSLMYLITLNRLLSVIHPIWYRSSFTKRKFFCTVGMVGVLVTGFMMIGAWIVYRVPTASSIGTTIVGSLYLFYFIFSVSSYALIFIRIRQSRESIQKDVDNMMDVTNRISGSTGDSFKDHKYTIPFVMSCTYIMLVIVPGMVINICHLHGCSKAALRLWDVSYCLNTVSDTLIYIFLDKDIRNYLQRRTLEK